VCSTLARCSSSSGASAMTMIVGAGCYAVYIASLAAAASPAFSSGAASAIVLGASGVIGFGAAILWVALGVFITQNSTRATYATNTGVFWAVFQLNNVVGNLVTWAVYTPALASSAEMVACWAKEMKSK
jgi:hypothetical protein